MHLKHCCGSGMIQFGYGSVSYISVLPDPDLDSKFLNTPTKKWANLKNNNIM